MNISNKIANMSSGDINVVAKESVKKSWSMTNAMKEQIIAYAKEDAKSGVYMGKNWLPIPQVPVGRMDQQPRLRTRCIRRWILSTWKHIMQRERDSQVVLRELRIRAIWNLVDLKPRYNFF